MPRATMVAAVRGCVVACVVAVLAAGCGLQKTPGAGGSGGAAGTSGGANGGGHGKTGAGGQQQGHGVATMPTTSGSPSAPVSECTISQVRVTVVTNAGGVA